MDDTTSKPLTRAQQRWLEHLQTWREQGGTLKAYAEANGLSVTGLYSARKALSARGAFEARKRTAPTFLPVRLQPGPSPLRVVFPNGVVVELPAGGDINQCAALVSTLAGAR